MFCIEYPFWWNNWLLSWSLYYIPNVILYNRLVLFEHCIHTFLLLCILFKIGRFCINKITHQGHIDGIDPWSLASFLSSIFLCTLNDITCPGWSYFLWDHLLRHIHMPLRLCHVMVLRNLHILWGSTMVSSLLIPNSLQKY